MVDKTRAKMKLLKISQTDGYPGKTLNFTCQYDSTIPEDQKFQKYTPSGTAEFHIDNDSALEFFKLGESYYLDFTKV